MSMFLGFFAQSHPILTSQPEVRSGEALIDRNAVHHYRDLYSLPTSQDQHALNLRIPYLLAATLVAGSLFYLSDSPGLTAAPLVSLTSTSGQLVNLADPEGKTRLISFWSPDCPISKKNMPTMSQLREQFDEQDFEILAVAMPYAGESEISAYMTSNDVGISVAHDKNGTVSDAFPGVRFTPTTFLIDGSGNIVWRHIGRMTETQGAQKIAEILQVEQLASR